MPNRIPHGRQTSCMIKRTYIEILNACNLSCAFCQKNTRPIRQMTEAEFRHVLHEVLPLTPYIYLHVQGEPLLHPQLDAILSACDEAGANVLLVTNGTFLSRWPHLYEHSCLHRISISLQSIEYQPDFEQYADSLLCFLQALPKDHPFVCDLRFWRSDQMDLPKTSRLLSLLKSRYLFEPSGRRDQYKLAEKLYVSCANSFEWPSSASTAPVRGTCLGGREQIAVLSDGTVVPCCLDADGHIPLGSIFETPLSDILQSSRYRALVQGFENRYVVEPFCAGCSFRHRFDR